MIFNDIEKNEPDVGRRILARLKTTTLLYYTFDVEMDNFGDKYYIEAAGEQYWVVDKTAIDAWIYLEELDNNVDW